jgi:hypothetical protein
LALILVVIGLVISGLCYRQSQIPHYLAVTSELSLNRYGNQARWADFRAVSVNLTASLSQPYDNVSLVQAYGNGSIATHAFWRIVIVLNQSESAPIRIEHDILPKANVSGHYGGVVSLRFAARGKFSLWVIAYGVHNDSMNFLQSFSENIETYQSLLTFTFSIAPVTCANLRGREC